MSPALDTSTTTDVPALLPVGIAGHSYQMDVRGYRRVSVQMLRQQADTTDLPSEQSLNPQGPWRRSQESWHHGAGQTFFDGKTSDVPADPERFNTSAGVDIWTRGQASLLYNTVRVYAPSASIVYVLGVGKHLYLHDGTSVYWSLDPTTTGATWTSSDIFAGQLSTTVQDIATNGSYVWAALSTSGLHRTVRGASTSTADVPAQACTMVAYALGRLLIADANVLYEVTSPLSAPAAVEIGRHPDTNFLWQKAAPGRNCIYAWGNTALGYTNTDYNVGIGTGAEVFRIGVVATTGALGAPTPATYLPDGETIYNLQFYAGAIIMATSRGLRVGVADAQGNIDYGPVIAGGDKPLAALEAQDRYVWFTGQGFGLNRLDLGYLTDTLTPAWAPDITITPADVDPGMAKWACSLTTGANPCFTYVSGAPSGADPTGVYRKTTTRVSSGTLEPGQIRFGTTATKTLRRLEIRHLPLPAGSSILCELKRDGGSYTTIGTSNTTSATQASFDIGSLSCETAELRFTLSRATDTTAGPTLTRWTLTALPTPRRDKRITLPLVLRESVENLQGEGKGLDVAAEVSFLETLWNDGTVFTLQLGGESMSAQIQDFQFEGESLTSGYADTNGYGSGRSVQGVYTVVVQTVG